LHAGGVLTTEAPQSRDVPVFATRPLKLFLLTLLTVAAAGLVFSLGPRSVPYLPAGFSSPTLAIELVDSPEQFQALVEQPALEPIGYASQQFWHSTAADLGFIAIYAWLFVALLTHVPKNSGGRGLRIAGVFAILMAAAADYVEDYGIIRALGREVSKLPPESVWLIASAAKVKWSTLGLGLLSVGWQFRPQGLPMVLRAASGIVALGYAAAGLAWFAGVLFNRPMWIGGGVLPLMAAIPIQVGLLAWAAWKAFRTAAVPDTSYTPWIDDVRAAELEYIRRRRQPPDGPAPDVATVSDSLVGLAMSGGGIRSATTNLGVLQALSRMGLLPLVDYVCTVSGGGYMGACLASLLSIRTLPAGPGPHPPGNASQYRYGHRSNLMFGTDWLRFPFNPEMRRAGAAGPSACAPAATDSLGKQIVAHLRTHGSFLIARRGVFKRDALRAVGHVLTGTVYHLLATLVILAAISLALMGTARLLEPDLDAMLKPSAAVAVEDVATVNVISGIGPSYAVTRIPAASFAPQLWDRITRVGTDVWDGLGPNGLGIALASGILVSVIVLGWFIIAARWWWPRGYPTDWKAGETREDRFDRIVIGFAVALVGIAAIGVPAFCIYWAKSQDIQRGLLVAPLLVLVGARVANFTLYPIIAKADGGRLGVDLWNRQFRSLWNTFQAATTYGVVATLLFTLLPIVAYTLWALVDGGTSAWSLLAPGVSLVVGRLLSGGGGSPTVGGRSLPPGLVRFLLGVAAAVFIGFVILAAATAAVSIANNYTWAGVAKVLAATVFVLALLSYGGNINKISPHYFYRDRLIETYLRTEIRGPGNRMDTLTDTMAMPLTDLHGEDPPAGALGNQAPYLLISSAINLAGSRDLTRKDRKSGHFLFSKYYCGSRQTGYRRTEAWRDGETKLGRAMTVSGAAAGTAIGYQTFFAQSFFTAIFNLRLGFWMLNPRTTGTDEFAFWPFYILQEAFAATSERTTLVNLSDGGHTGDNVGIYPLLERRCQVIIAVDAEADASLSFGSFTEALRQAYVDLGVDIDIDLSLIRPNPETGLSKSHCAVGRVRYPECPGRPNWIIYLKNSLTGDEPAPILNYKSRCSAFPHETTADQFFDDAQFESYRSLGDHIAADAFERWLR
jgi:hypothetical protein